MYELQEYLPRTGRWITITSFQCDISHVLDEAKNVVTAGFTNRYRLIQILQTWSPR